MWIAKMDSEHYEFMAGADTQEEAHSLVARAFWSHLAGTLGADHVEDWLAQEFGDGEPVENLDAALDEYYGVHVFQVDVGDTLRDGRFIILVDPPKERRYLEVRYDVTGLTDEEIGQLALEAAAQAEDSDGHPAVEVETSDA